jgi:hypothetical protein
MYLRPTRGRAILAIAQVFRADRRPLGSWPQTAFWEAAARQSGPTGRRGIVTGGHVDFIKPLTGFVSGALGYTAGTYYRPGSLPGAFRGAREGCWRRFEEKGDSPKKT